MQRRKKKKSILLSITKVVIGLTVFSGLAIIYARFIEPECLRINSYEIIDKAGNLKGKMMKVLQISDLHLGNEYTTSHLKRVVEEINNQGPSIVVFTGDLIDHNYSFSAVEETIEALNQIDAPLGKFAVYGNHDYGENGASRYRYIMKESGFSLLTNESIKLKLKDDITINVIGLDDYVFGNPSVPFAMEGIQESEYNIVIVHEPDSADEIIKYPIDLQLSGHSHGGQVRLPIIGAIFTPQYAKKYIKGLYTFEENNRFHLYVNVGIGTSFMRYRFLNMPEIAVFSIGPQ